MHNPVVARFNRLTAVRIMLWALTLLVGVAMTMPARAAGNDVEALVVKYRDEAVTDGNVLPHALALRLSGALGTPFTVTGRTQDGAFRIALQGALPLDDARAAMNRVRLDPLVLYSGIAPGPPVPDTTGRPTDRIIVKFRDPGLVANARMGLPLDPSRVAQLANAGGQALAWRRGAFDGANVLQMLVRLPIGQVEALTAAIAQLPDVEYAQPDYIRTAKIVPTDPCYASASVVACNGRYQWDLFDPVGGINMPAAWDITTGSASVNVAVIDTGALLNHPDLVGRFVGGYDMIADCAVGNDAQPGPCTWTNQTPDMASRDSDASDPGDWVTAAENTGSASAPPYNWFQGCGASSSSWHGTHVSGTIAAAANNSEGIAGINWVSKVVPVRVLGKCGGYTSDIAAAMVWAAGGSVSGVPANANPARVLSLSLGGGGSCDSASQNAINTALGLGAVVVVAAGNENDSAANHSPASCNGVITVAATTKLGRRAWYSNFGALVEIAAPGGAGGQADDTGIISSISSGTQGPAGYIYAGYSGTSMATPHVSGVASLMFSVNPSLTPAQVLSKLQTTARAFPTPGPACTTPQPQSSACNCTTALCGAGILDAGAAVLSAAGGTLPPTTTTLGTSGTPVTFGATVTFTATVAGINPTGTVNFRDGASTIVGCGAAAVTGTGNSRQALCVTSALTVGTHSITAAYSGNVANAGSTSLPLSQVVNAALTPTSTTLASSLNPANAGATVTFTATVTGGSSPTGTVNFRDGAASITGCGAVPLVLVGGGKGGPGVPTATCATSALAAGTHSITAVYSGNATNATSTSPAVSQVINGAGPVPTSTGMQTSGTPSTVGAIVTFTATVNGNAPTGTVNFRDGAVSICAAVPLTGGSGNSRTAQCATSALTQGTHSITGVYSGDAGNLTSTSPALSQVVNAAGPVATTTGMQTSGTPSTVGASVTFTATVNGAAPNGTVNFLDGAVAICTAVPLTGGSGNSRTAQCATSTLTQGTHSITGVYSGDAGNLTSTSPALTQVVNASGLTTSTTTLATSANPAFPFAAVTFTATVTGTAPTGTVNFKDGALSIGGCAAAPVTGAGNARTATCTTSSLSFGVHSITASYGGDVGNTASVSAPLTQSIGTK